MNKRWYIAILCCSVLVTIGLAQQGPLGREARQRIESQRAAFITERLRLSPEESRGFWPLYYEYRDALKEMREDFERPDLLQLTDEEASSLIEQHLQNEQRKLELKRNLLTRLRTVIPPRKIILLHKAEQEFNRELLRRAQEFRKE
jgi:hypothetical protein